jgi:hypothetical protein
MRHIYKVINSDSYNQITDYRVKCRRVVPRQTKGVILIDNNDLTKIPFECDINFRGMTGPPCWELYLTDELTENVETLARSIGAVAYA